MKLIADSGSTKTDWVLAEGAQPLRRLKTQGINPFHQSEADILGILRQELLPQLSAGMAQGSELAAHVDKIAFYGSGVRPELQPVMERLLLSAIPSAQHVEAHSDLFGAARAVLGRGPGIACILGTGANSCLWDGSKIVQNTPPLGYILGDEGSGAVLGARFLNALYKGFLPATLVTDFERSMGMSMADVIGRVYRQPMANRFLASLSPFIKQHCDVAGVRQIVVDNFRNFFRRNLTPYGQQNLLVGFVGSIAYHYRDCLCDAAEAENIQVGQILKSPITGLLGY